MVLQAVPSGYCHASACRLLRVRSFSRPCRNFMLLRLLFLLHQVPDRGEDEDAVGGGHDMKLEFLTRAPERAAALVVGAERIEASHCYMGNVYFNAGTNKLR
jgi:hypothetical protein